MVISHKYKFIFIKTIKTAGTSIEVFLSDRCGEEDIFTPISPYVPPHRARNYEVQQFFNHITARQVRERVAPEIWNSYYKFCVERNPWDKTLSHYHMNKHRFDPPIDFETYLGNDHFPINFPKYLDNDGSLLVDRVLRYESLAEDLGEVFGQLGIAYDGNLGVNAKSEYRSDRRHYREVYTPAQAERVAQLFDVEITLHGYTY